MKPKATKPLPEALLTGKGTEAINTRACAIQAAIMLLEEKTPTEAELERICKSATGKKIASYGTYPRNGLEMEAPLWIEEEDETSWWEVGEEGVPIRTGWPAQKPFPLANHHLFDRCFLWLAPKAKRISPEGIRDIQYADDHSISIFSKSQLPIQTRCGIKHALSVEAAGKLKTGEQADCVRVVEIIWDLLFNPKRKKKPKGRRKKKSTKAK